MFNANDMNNSAGGGGGNNEMLRKQLELPAGPNRRSPAQGGPGAPGMGGSQLAAQLSSGNKANGNNPSGGAGGSSSLLLTQLEKQTTSDPNPNIINQVASLNANKVPNDSLNSLLHKQPMMPGASGGGPIKTEADIKQESDIKKEIKDEPMDSADIKPPGMIKSEMGVKKEEPMDTKPAMSDYKPTPVTFTMEELKKALDPPLMKMYNQEPEALFFRFPVDPEALGIPDYFDIIKKPMDLSSIKKKLDAGEYKDPWEFVDDVWLMFENAWTYNKKNSRVYKYCSKVKIWHFVSQQPKSKMPLFAARRSVRGRDRSSDAVLRVLLW